MKTGETVYLGDGAYLRNNGYSVEFLANHHEHPTDTVSIEMRDIPQLIRHLTRAMQEEGHTE